MSLNSALGDQINDAMSLSRQISFRCLQSIYMLFAFAIPICQIVDLSVIWIVPLSLRQLKFLYLFTDFAGAWGALEVFVLTIFAAVLEISQFARYIIGKSLPGNDQGQLFDVKTELNSGIWVLLAAAVMLVLTNGFVHRCAGKAIKDREREVRDMVRSMPVRFLPSSVDASYDNSSVDSKQYRGSEDSLLRTP